MLLSSFYLPLLLHGVCFIWVAFLAQCSQQGHCGLINRVNICVYSSVALVFLSALVAAWCLFQSAWYLLLNGLRSIFIRVAFIDQQSKFIWTKRVNIAF